METEKRRSIKLCPHTDCYINLKTKNAQYHQENVLIHTSESRRWVSGSDTASKRRWKAIIHSDTASNSAPDMKKDALACVLLPEIQAFFESEEGQREFAEWKAH